MARLLKEMFPHTIIKGCRHVVGRLTSGSTHPTPGGGMRRGRTHSSLDFVQSYSEPHPESMFASLPPGGLRLSLAAGPPSVLALKTCSNGCGIDAETKVAPALLTMPLPEGLWVSYS